MTTAFAVWIAAGDHPAPTQSPGDRSVNCLRVSSDCPGMHHERERVDLPLYSLSAGAGVHEKS